MKRSRLTSPTVETPLSPGGAIDLELVSRRILKLAEIAMLDHIDSLERSQVGGAIAFQVATEELPQRRMCSGR